MKIIEYDDKYKDDVKDLLVELQEYIASIDKDHYNIVGPDYREKYFPFIMDIISSKRGKMFLAIENDKAVGLVSGVINNDDLDTYEFKAPKRGRILDLVVSKKMRGSGVGSLLMDEMENYLKSVGCKAILLEVFGYNDNAKKFYDGRGYVTRTSDVMKKFD